MSRPNNVGASYILSTEEEINLNLERLWKLEELDKNNKEITPEQMECEQNFKKNVSRESSGRIVVKLPFKESPSSLGQSRNTALRRFSAQERRLQNNLELKSEYNNFMRDYENLGHMSLFKNLKLDEPHYFIPHHCVLKPNSTSTKLRVVFDASCATSSDTSLNDI
uniref:Uncharacterized protein n=1 Tax=Musca domestica TaxID=7370 RepID=A0A1I8N6A2_MUSDO